MKTIQGTDISLFLKTEHTTENMIKYFTGIDADTGLLILFKNKKPRLFLSSLEEIPNRKDIIIKHLDFKKIEKLLAKENPKIIGTHDLKLTKRGLDLFRKITPKKTRFKDITKDLEQIRSIKSPEEIKTLKKGIKITEEIISHLIKKIPKMTYEHEAVQFLKMECLKQNVKTSFEPLIATGTNAANPHYFTKPGTKLKNGFCIIDFGIIYNGLCSDITRTIYLGTPSKKEIDFYNKIKDSQIKLELTTKPGEKMNFPFKMIHALGHGIGIEVHEPPMLPFEKVEVGNCIAIEPGIYTKQMSVRVEDDFLMTSQGLERLTKSSRELTIVKFNK